MPRRTRYQQGSVQREKRQSGADVWVFRWWEPAGRRLDEHCEQIVSSHLRFEVGASGTG
jgi:hypothetical protein